MQEGLQHRVKGPGTGGLCADLGPLWQIPMWA